MNNQLIPIKKENIFTKIKNFLHKLFGKKENQTEMDYVNIVENTNENKLNQNVFNDSLKIEDNSKAVYQDMERENFIKKIEEDDTILDKLSLDRLKILEKYYEKRVKEKELILMNLQNNS